MPEVENRILIIDDDADFAGAVTSFLTANSFTVFWAQTGQEGVKLAKLERPNLILMDITMSERSEAFLSIQEIRRTEELKNIPIFVLSASCASLPDFETPRGSWQAHDVFLPKPVSLAQLLQKIRQHIRSAVLERTP